MLTMIVNYLMPFIAAAYPMAIILVVEYQNSSQYSTRNSSALKDPESGIQFASPSSDSSTDGTYLGPQNDISIVQSIADHIHAGSHRSHLQSSQHSQGVHADVRSDEKEDKGTSSTRDVHESSAGTQTRHTV